MQRLKVVKKVQFGVYLGEDTSDTKNVVLLPAKQVPQGTKIGDEIKVFLYRDSSDRLIATTNRPYITMGHIKPLRVVQVSPIGAFLDWGLEKDLFLPFKEQTVPAQKGNEYLVKLYIDKSDRLCASMKLYHDLYTDHDYQKGDEVSGIIYDKSDELGYFVAVDNMFSALIPKREAYGKLYVGAHINGRVIEVREDGKLTLAVRDKIPEQMNKDAQYLLELIDKKGGSLGFGEKSDPEIIKRETGLSKAAFKRAVGRLLKEGSIVCESDDIKRK